MLQLLPSMKVYQKKDIPRWGIFDKQKKIDKNNFLVNGRYRKAKFY